MPAVASYFLLFYSRTGTTAPLLYKMPTTSFTHLSVDFFIRDGCMEQISISCKEYFNMMDATEETGKLSRMARSKKTKKK